ncbi:MAG: VCBS repeat-containing protein [Verrucomicrobia bacterium]|nr:VCBS repeat-containing protein [Verrucomicrobiota bacterium]
MNRLWAVIGIVWASAVLPGWTGTTNSVPFSDDFESYTNGTPLVDGTNGWYGSDAIIVVQTQTVYSGTQAAEIPLDCTLSNRCVDATPTNIWSQMDVRLVRYNGTNAITIDTNATVLFYVNSNGYFTVHDGPPTNWVVVSNMASGAAAPIITNTDWVQLRVLLDYTNRTWSLYMSTNLMKENIGFVNSNASTLNGFDLYNGGLNTAFLDNVSVVANWRPFLRISTTNLTRSILDGTNAASQTFEIWKVNGTNSVIYTNTVTYTVGTNWLSVSPTNGTTAGEHDIITVAYNTASLAPAATPYTATIQVTGVDDAFGLEALDSPQTISVSVTVLARPVLSVDPVVLTNTVSYGHRASSQTVKVWNSSVEPRTPMTFSAISGTNWIAVTPTNGSCVNNTNTLTFNYPTENLAPGWHTGSVAILTVESNQLVRVNMRVNATPILGVNLLGLTNSVILGQNAQSQYFTIRNSSLEPRGTLRYNLSDNMTWATMTPANGTSTGETNTITVTYSTATLPVGSYAGSITISGIDESTGDPVTDVELSVTMTVGSQILLTTSADSLSISALQNCSTTTTFQLWNGGVIPRGRMNYAISEDLSWMTISPLSGTITDDTNTISVIGDAGTMATGTYSGTITIDAVDAQTGLRVSGAPKAIPVTFIVSPRTPVNYEKPEIRGIPFVGQTLNAWRGLWQNDNRLSFAYQWQMANDKYGHGLINITNSQGVLITTTNYTVTTEARAKYLRIQVTATDGSPWPVSASNYSDFTDARRIKAPADDFSGDGQADLWLFDAPTGLWRVSFIDGTEAAVTFGGPGYLAVPGDYDGDGFADPAIYEEATGLWSVMLSASGYATASVRFGGPGYSSVASDYDGDCKLDPAIYDKITGLWAALMSSSSYMPASATFGGAGYQEVHGDYDGDGKTDPAVYQSSSGLWMIMLSGSSYAISGLAFGGPMYTPAPGDYDGDGKTDMAVYWVPGNHWWLRASSTGVVREESFGTSAGNGIPVSGYYDQDAQCDPATVHISGDFIVWSIQRSSLGYKGQSFQIDTGQWRVSW